jgi:hypothetical protein
MILALLGALATGGSSLTRIEAISRCTPNSSEIASALYGGRYSG